LQITYSTLHSEGKKLRSCCGSSAACHNCSHFSRITTSQSQLLVSPVTPSILFSISVWPLCVLLSADIILQVQTACLMEMASGDSLAWRDGGWWGGMGYICTRLRSQWQPSAHQV